MKFLLKALKYFWQKLLVLSLCFSAIAVSGSGSAYGQPVANSGSAIISLVGLQARPNRPVRPVRPAPRPQRPATRPSAPIRQPSADVIVNDRALQARMQKIERASDRLVARTREALEDGKKATRLVSRLQETYGLTFVDIRGRFQLVRYREIIGVNLSQVDLAAAGKAGFKRYRATNLPTTTLKLDLLQVPENMPMQEVMARLKAAGATGLFTYNSVYFPAGVARAELQQATPSVPRKTSTQIAGKHFIVGMIDTGIHDKHKALKSASITQENFGRGDELTPRNHGTAVASIMVAHGTPSIYLADVFSGPILFSDVESIVRALDWLAGRGLGVINMSLAGPENPLLAAAVAQLSGKGHIIVAAVGNNGKNGDAQYPASYPAVLGVTAVDAKRRIFKDAYQGQSVDYAARGVKVRAAALRGSKKYSGTSFASPVVAAFLAEIYPSPDMLNARKSINALNAQLVDLGERGHDPVFGFGFLPTSQENP